MPIVASSNQATAFAQALDEDLALERRAIAQTINHIGTQRTPREEKHATTALHQRIDSVIELTQELSQLGCTPGAHTSPPHIGHNHRDALIEDLSLEKLLLARYKKRYQQATELDLDSSITDAVNNRIHAVRDNVKRLEAGLRQDSAN